MPTFMSVEVDDNKEQSSPSWKDDPIDVRRVMVDAAEFFCEEIMQDRKNRVQRMCQLQYFLHRLGTKKLSFGRLFTRVLLVEVLMDICAIEPNIVNDEEDEKASPSKAKRKHQTKSLVNWTASEWEESLQKFQKLGEKILRVDASTLVIPETMTEFPEERESADVDFSDDDESIHHEMEDNNLNETLADDERFNLMYGDMVRQFRFHQCLSHLRKELEKKGMDSVSDTESINVKYSDLVAFEQSLAKHFNYSSHEKDLLHSLLLHEKDGARRTRRRGLALVPLNEMRAIMSKKDFSLASFQKKIEELLVEWAGTILPKPTLTQLSYGKSATFASTNKCAVVRPAIKRGKSFDRVVKSINHGPTENIAEESNDDEADEDMEEPSQELLTQDDQVAKSKGRLETGKRKATATQSKQSKIPEVDTLIQARDTLRHNVVDPLAESRVIAAEVATSASVPRQINRARKSIEKGSFCKPKTSARKESFDDSDEEDENIEDPEATLSSVPKRVKINASRPSPVPPPLISHNPITGHKKRRKFTDEEKTCIRVGVEKFGAGRWADIKAHYPVKLRYRTAVNIKDCYRTMLKHGEV